MRVLILIVVTFMLGPAITLGVTTGKLLTYCETYIAVRAAGGTTDIHKAAISENCGGYLLGWWDGITEFYPQTITKCFPVGEIRSSQLARIFIKWATEHPELLHEQRSAGVKKALTEAWGCKPKS